MRRRSLGSKPHPGRRRGEQSFKHSPRQDFSPRPYGRGEANQRSNYSPGRQSHHHDQHQQYNSSSAHYVSDLRDRDAAATRNSLSRVHTSLDADSTSFMDQSSSIPQLSSNPTTAALEASLLILTELATNLNPAVPHYDNRQDTYQHGAVDGYDVGAHGRPIPGLMDIHLLSKSNQEQGLHVTTPSYRDGPVNDNVCNDDRYVSQRRPNNIHNQSARLSPNPVHIDNLYEQDVARYSGQDNNKLARRLVCGSGHSSGRHGDELVHSSGRRGNSCDSRIGDGGRAMDVIAGYSGRQGDMDVSSRDVGCRADGGFESVHGRRGGRGGHGPRLGMVHGSQARVKQSSRPRSDSRQGIVHVKDGVSSSIQTERRWHGHEARLDLDNDGGSSGMANSDGEYVKHLSDGWYNQNLGFNESRSSKVECDDFFHGNDRLDSDLNQPMVRHSFDSHSSWDSQQIPPALDDDKPPRPASSKSNQARPVLKGNTPPRSTVYDKLQSRDVFGGNTSPVPASSNNGLDGRCFSNRSSPHQFEPDVDPDFDEHPLHLRKRVHDTPLPVVIKKHCKSNLYKQSEAYRESGYNKPHPNLSFQPRVRPPTKLGVQKRLGPQPEGKDSERLNIHNRLGPGVSDRGSLVDLRQQLNKQAESSSIMTGRSVLNNSGDKHLNLASPDSVHRPHSTRGFPRDTDLLQSLIESKLPHGSRDSGIKTGCDKALPASSDELADAFINSKGVPVDRPFPSQPVMENVSASNPDISRIPITKCAETILQHSASGSVISDGCKKTQKGISSDRHLTRSSTIAELSSDISQGTGTPRVPKSAMSLFPSAVKGGVVSHDSTAPELVVKERPLEPALPDVKVVEKINEATKGASFNTKEVLKSSIASKEVTKTMVKVIHALKKQVKVVSEDKAGSGKQTAPSVAEASSNLVKERDTHENKLSSNLHIVKDRVFPFGPPQWNLRPEKYSAMLSNSAGVLQRLHMPNQSSTRGLPDLHLDNCSLGQLSDSDGSECGLVIDLNHVPDSPCLQRCDPSSSMPSTKAVEMAEGEAGKVFLPEDVCVSIARDEVGSVLVNQLLKCKPSPLHDLYYSMEVVINTIHQGDAPASAVLQAFRFYAVSMATQPFSLPRLYRAELASLNGKCLHEVGKWKVQIQVFCLLSSTLSERNDLKSDVTHVGSKSEVGLETPDVTQDGEEHQAPRQEVDVLSVLSCVGKPTGEVSKESLSVVQRSEPWRTHDISELGLDVSLEQYMSVCSDPSEGGECSMSVCSTISEEHSSSRPVSPGMVDISPSVGESKTDSKRTPLREANNWRRRDRSISLSSGELTPSPPPTHTVQCTVKKSLPPMVAKTKVECSKTKTLVRTTMGNIARPLVRTTKSISSDMARDDGTTTQLVRSGREKSTQPLHSSGGYSHDSGCARPHPSGKHTAYRSSYSRKWSVYGERLTRCSARSISPVTQSRRSHSPKSVHRQRKSRSRSPRRREYDPRRNHRSRSPPSKSGSKSRDRQRGSMIEELDDDEDMELLQLKKEVILSIVQKPESGKLGTKVVIASENKKSRTSVNPKCDNQRRVKSSQKSKAALSSVDEVKWQIASTSSSSISVSSTSHSDAKSAKVIPKSSSRYRTSCQQNDNSKPTSASVSAILNSQKVKSSLTKKPKSSVSKSKVRSSATNSPVLHQAGSNDPLPNTKPPLNNLKVQSSLTRKPKSSQSVSQIGCSGPSSPALAQAESQDPLPNNLTVLNCPKVKSSLTRKSKSSPSASQIGSSGPSSPVVPQTESHDPLPNVKSQEGSSGSAAPSSEATNEKSVSVMVFPGKESTWKIPSFQITSLGYDSDSEVGDDDPPDTATLSVVSGMSEISSYLAEARKVASSQIFLTKSAVVFPDESMDLPTPPASLPPAQQKEYIILKQKIALHERKKKRLSNNPSRSASPHSLSLSQTAPLPVSVKSGHNDSKPPSPPLPSNSVEDTVSSRSLVMEKPTEKPHDVVEEDQKELDDWLSKLEHHKSLEEQEQRTIAELTNQLAECVSEVEEHECSMDTLQKQLASLQTQLEKAAGAVNHCEQKMSDLRNNVRCAQQKKAEYTIAITMCESQIRALRKLFANKHDVEFASISDSEVLVSVKMAEVSLCPSAPQMAEVSVYPGGLQVAEVSVCSGDPQMTEISVCPGNPQMDGISIGDTHVADESMCMDIPLYSSIKHVLPQHILEVEPVSDAEDIGVEEKATVECQQTSLSAVQIISNAGEDLNRMKDHTATGSSSRLLLENMKSDLCEHKDDDKYMESYAGPPAVSKEVVIQSTNSSVCRRTLPYDRPTKLDKMLNVVMHNALKFPCIENGSQSPMLQETSDNTAQLSTEGNVQPLLNSVMSSLTQQFFNEALSTVQIAPRCLAMDGSFAGSSGDWYTNASNLDSCFHTCTEDAFTLSQDDPPMLVLPMVVEGEIDLEIQSPSISTVAMDIMYDGIIACPASPEESVNAEVIIFDDDHESCSTFFGENFEDVSCASEVSLPESLDISCIPSNVGDEGKQAVDSQFQDDQVGHSSTLELKSFEYVQTKTEPSVPSIQSKVKSEPKSTRDLPLDKPKPSSQKDTNTMKVAGIGSIAENQSKLISSRSYSSKQLVSSSAEGKTKPVSNGKLKPVSALAKSKPKLTSGPSICKPKPVICQAESKVKPKPVKAESKVKPEPVICQAESKVRPEPVICQAESKVRPEPVICQAESKVRPEPVICQAESKVRPEPVKAESKVRPEPVKAESKVRPKPVISQAESKVRPEPVICQAESKIRPEPVKAESKVKPEPVISQAESKIRPEPVKAESKVRPKPVISQAESKIKPEPVISQAESKVKPEPVICQAESKVRPKPVKAESKVKPEPVKAKSKVRPEPVICQAESKVKPKSVICQAESKVKPKSVISHAESKVRPVGHITEGKPKVAGSVQVMVLSQNSSAADKPKPGVGLPESMSTNNGQLDAKSTTAINLLRNEPDKIRTILQRYMAHIEEVKGQLAAKTGLPKVETCARTSGLRATLPVTQGEPSAAGVDEGSSMAESFIKMIILNHDVASLVSRVGSLARPVGLGMPLNFSVYELLSSNCVIVNPSLLPSPLKLTQCFLKILENPSLSNSIPIAPNPEDMGYKPYCSPLLMFASYRLNLNFSSSAKAPLNSITYSNKLDPHHIMCRFELTGTCSDSSCTAQHLRDLQMTKDELVQDLVSYCPTIAGCTGQELADVEGATRGMDSVCGKLSSFSSKFLKRYVDKVSDEELWKLVVYDTNKERVKTRLRREVSFEDRPWTVSSRTSSKAPSSGRTMERSSLPLQSLPVEHRKRYFNVEDDQSTKSSPRSATVGSFVSSAKKLVAESNLQQAIVTLEEGLKVRQDSEEMWLVYLQLKSEVTGDSDLQSLYGLFSKAVTVSQSYAVVLETVRLARCYKSKLSAINVGLALTRCLSPSDVASRYSFELFINVILLNLQTGRFSTALKHFDQARRPIDPEQTATMNNNKFSGLFGVLERQECILMCLCHLTLVYSGSLPVSLFTGDSHHVIPARLTSYQFFAVPFNSSVNLSPNSYKKILRLFKFYLDQLHNPSLPSCQTVERILPLFRNVILFETMHGSHQKAINILIKLTLLCPGLPDLWMMLARIKELDGIDGCVTMEEAICISPMNPELYYLSARLELSRIVSDAADTSTCTTESCGKTSGGRVHRVGKAVEWLSRCVRAFYKTDSAETMCTAQVLSLYRKLLNQLIGYQQTVPMLAEGVDPRNLKEAQCPLWMCYCLLVELTVVPCTSVSGGELFHQSVENAYESAVHAVRSPEGHKTLWREYIYYMRGRVATGNQEDFQRFLDCVHRCLLDVECSSTTSSRQSASQSTTGSNTDYSFHNEMISVVTAYLPPDSVFKFTILTNFARRFPRNTTLLTELVQCALLQKPPNVNIAQTTLAEFLALYPQSPALWKQAIQVELELDHFKEARWMFNKALQALPLHMDLWRDFLVFELKCVADTAALSSSSSPDFQYQRIIALVEKARAFGIDLLLVLRDLATTTAPPTS